MAERTTGLHRLITIPRLYTMFQDLLGGAAAREAFQREFFPNLKGMRVLEVGCGPGTWLTQLRDCQSYLGIDWNSRHIHQARAQYGSDRHSFLVGDVSSDIPASEEPFDLIAAFGLLHHLDKEQLGGLIRSVRPLLSPDGRFIAIDPVYHPGQNWFAKWMNDRDSGQNIRRETGYRGELLPFFKTVETTLCTGRLRVPYSHCVTIAHNAN